MTDHNARQAGLTEHQWHEAFAAKAINGCMLNVRMAVEIVMESLAAHSADARNGEGTALQRFAPSNRHEDGMVPHPEGDYVLYADIAAPAAPATGESGGAGYRVTVGALRASNGTTYVVGIHAPGNASPFEPGYMSVREYDEEWKAEHEAAEWREFFAATPPAAKSEAASQPGEMGAGVPDYMNMQHVGVFCNVNSDSERPRWEQMQEGYNGDGAVHLYRRKPTNVDLSPEWCLAAVQREMAASAQQDEREAFAISEEDFEAIDAAARKSFKRSQSMVRGQQVDRADGWDSHVIWATADLLRARRAQQVQADAGAVYQYSDDGENWTDVDWMTYQSIDSQFRRIVYKRPAAESDKRDAARYRWLREACWIDEAIMLQAGIDEHRPETMDAAIDATMDRSALGREGSDADQA